MMILKRALLVSLLPIMVFGYTHLVGLMPVIVQGSVIEEQFGKPVNNAYVFIVKGEEEALTEDKGGFKIESWQKLPFVMTIEHKDYETVRVTISDPVRKQIIRLKHK